MITREQVVELAQTGSVQLPPEYMPRDPQRLIRVTHSLRPGNPKSLDILCEVYPQLRRIYAGVINHAGYLYTESPKIRAFSPREASRRPSWHQDYYGNQDGFSLITSGPLEDEPTDGSFNTLITGGRGKHPHPNGSELLKEYQYANGPVLIAQGNFDVAGLQTPEANSAHHAAYRNIAAFFAAIDFMGVERPASLQGFASVAGQ